MTRERLIQSIEALLEISPAPLVPEESLMIVSIMDAESLSRAIKSGRFVVIGRGTVEQILIELKEG